MTTLQIPKPGNRKCIGPTPSTLKFEVSPAPERPTRTALIQTCFRQQINPRGGNSIHKVLLKIKRLVKRGLKFKEIGVKLGYAASMVNRKYINCYNFGLPEIEALKHSNRISKQKDGMNLVLWIYSSATSTFPCPNPKETWGIQQTYSIWILNN